MSDQKRLEALKDQMNSLLMLRADIIVADIERHGLIRQSTREEAERLAMEIQRIESEIRESWT